MGDFFREGEGGYWSRAQVLTLALAPAAEGYPSDDYNDPYSICHNLYSRQHFCKEKRNGLRRNWGTASGLGLGSLGSKVARFRDTQGL